VGGKGNTKASRDRSHHGKGEFDHARKKWPGPHTRTGLRNTLGRGEVERERSTYLSIGQR